MEWPKNIILNNYFTYLYNGNIDPGFDKGAYFWNIDLGMKLFNDKATISLLAYDILNQSINSRRTTTNDFIKDRRDTVLQQYFMISFKYTLNRF